MNYLKKIINNISRIYSNKVSNYREINIIKAPLKYGQLRDGVDKGPDFLIETLKNKLNIIIIKEIYKKELYTCRDKLYSNIILPNQDIVGDFCKNLAEEVYNIHQNNKNQFLLILGGDHSISIGSISGLLKSEPNLGIIYIDAHSDIHTVNSSETKNIHGMVNSFLLRLFNPNILYNFLWMYDYPKLNSYQLAYIGLRSVDKAEKEILSDFKKNNNMYISNMEDIHNLGIETVVNNAIKFLGNRPIHISFDIDSLDPSLAPSTGYNCSDGLKYNDLIKLLSIIKDKTNIISMDLVEVNPFIGNKNDVKKTLKISNDILKTIL